MKQICLTHVFTGVLFPLYTIAEMCLWKELCGENNENIRLSYDLKTVELRNGKTDVIIGDFYTGLFFRGNCELRIKERFGDNVLAYPIFVYLCCLTNDTLVYPSLTILLLLWSYLAVGVRIWMVEENYYNTWKIKVINILKTCYNIY